MFKHFASIFLFFKIFETNDKFKERYANIRNSLLTVYTCFYVNLFPLFFTATLFPSVHSSGEKTVETRTSTKLNGYGRESTSTLMRLREARAARKITSAVAIGWIFYIHDRFEAMFF